MRAPGAPPADGDGDALWPEPPPPAGDPRETNFTRSGVGGAQGRCLSTQWTVAPFNECLHRVQKRSPTTVFCGQADDYAMNDTVPQVLNAYKTKIDFQREDYGIFEQPSKAVIHTHAGNLSDTPEWLPGSPHHRGGRVHAFRAVGTFFGHDHAVISNLTDHLMAKLAPLDLVDSITDTAEITTTAQIKYNLIKRIYAKATHYIATVTPPPLATAPIAAATARLRRSWEAAIEADASPQPLRDRAWQQALLPSTHFGGMDIGAAGGREEDIFAAGLLAPLPRLRPTTPALAAITDTAGLAAAPGFVRGAVQHYEKLRDDRERIAGIHAKYATAKFAYHTCRGGKLARFRPRSRLPEPDTMPPAKSLLFDASNHKPPGIGALAAVTNHSRWLSQHARRAHHRRCTQRRQR